MKTALLVFQNNMLHSINQSLTFPLTKEKTVRRQQKKIITFQPISNLSLPVSSTIDQAHAAV